MNTEALIPFNVAKTPEEIIKSSVKTRKIFHGDLKTLKQRLTNRAKAVRKRYGTHMVARDLIFRVLEEIIFEKEYENQRKHRDIL